MAANLPPIGSFLSIDPAGLQGLIDTLQRLGYQTVGPQVREGAVVYGNLDFVDQLPRGMIDRQDGGSYRLEKRDGAGLFDYVVGPDSLKKYLFPPCETLLSCQRTNGQWQFRSAEVAHTPLAVIGLRSCDLHALAVQDRVFLEGPYVDPGYATRRQDLFIVAVNCRQAAPTCFCHSLNTGPEVRDGFDLVVSEVENQLIVQVGTERGAEVMVQVDWVPATLSQMQLLQEASTALKQAMHKRENSAADGVDGGQRQRSLNPDGLRNLLMDNLDHPRWAEVAERCLACSNCTMVCPTCFCAAIEEVSDLTGDQVQRERRWDSCFTAEHSYMNTGTVRKSTTSRYRQWLTHKLATWRDQFGVCGCVGCGRCITWCPVGIDLTEEVAAIRGDEQ